jgi:Protein of unknown function (DUF1553)/Protein of unknown function (DUF1549)/Planctomycete cytochrome C
MPSPIRLNIARVLVLPFIAAVMLQPVNGQVSFNRDIRPIMSNTCFRCHGPDQSSRMVGMRLDLRDEAIKPRKNGTPIVPGKPEESLIIKRIFETDPARRMPPIAAHRDLTDAQKETVRRWIAEGAQYEGHWAYQPVHRPGVPQTGVNPIDAFVQAKLTQEGLTPAKEADKRTLIRRVTIDLTGLAPTPDAVENFIGDHSPYAYEILVDGLMNSPRYAEKQAMHWLDAVRYADTAGFHGDNPYPVWPYRDYVLRAFRDNKPFDEFTREQLAGDLLPNASTDQKIASAYNRLNRVSAEGGLQEKEYLAKYGADRVRTITMVWLASTVGCAECHDHKFDPIKAKDFYAMKAFFADVKESGMAIDGHGETGPESWGAKLDLPSVDQQRQLEELTRQLTTARQELDKKTKEKQDQQRNWEKAALAQYDNGELRWNFQHPVAAVAERSHLTIHDDLQIRTGSNLRVSLEPVTGLVVASGPDPDNDVYTVTLKPGPGTWKSIGLEMERDDSNPGVDIARGGLGVGLTEVEAEVFSGNTKSAKKLHFALACAGGSLSGYKNPTVDFSPVAAIDGNPATTWDVRGSGVSVMNPFASFQLAEPLATDANSTIVIRLRQQSQIRGSNIGRFRIALSRGTAWPDDQGLAALLDDGKPDPNAKTNWGLPQKVVAGLRVAEPMRNPVQNDAITIAFQSQDQELVLQLRRVAELEAVKRRLELDIPRVMVTEAAAPSETRVLPRGNWMDDTGDVVQPAIPGFLGKLDTGSRVATRLDLANWIVSPTNPLTARATVNRIWKDFFGIGISKSVEDFGSQGELPTNLDLLDWLASEFVHPEYNAEGTHDWDMKHIVRTIVTSRTYRQSSLSTPELDEKDPDNRFLARQSRYRVDAEVVHDLALQVSGLLVEKFGGPSVRPYEPAGYLAALNYPKREYYASHGEDLYRRGIYTFWQRTFLHPSLLAFDAPSREECTLTRVTSNTPLQALDLMNDPIYVEASRVFAERVLKNGGNAVGAQLNWAFRQALDRTPDDAEHKVLADLYTSSLAKFSRNRSAARELLQVGEFPRVPGLDDAKLAAMTSVTRVILNLHELINRD